MTDIFNEDEEQLHDDHVEALNARLRLMKDWKDTFSTEHGRRVLMDLLDESFMYDSVFTGNAKTYYNAAFQDFGTKILDALASADPETFLWVHAQRANHLKKITDDEIASVRKIEQARKD